MTTKNSYVRGFLYPTGLISLILLPAFSLYYLNKHHAFKQYRVIEVNWWSPSYHKEWGWPVESHPTRQYINIHLTGDRVEDERLLNHAQQEIRQIIQTEDTVKGVHFYFDNNSKYWSLIRVFNICLSENAKGYMPDKNDIWVYNTTAIIEMTKRLAPLYELSKSEKQIREKQARQESQKQINYDMDIIKTYWSSGILFIAMAVLSISKLITLKKATNKRANKAG